MIIAEMKKYLMKAFLLLTCFLIQDCHCSGKNETDENENRLSSVFSDKNIALIIGVVLIVYVLGHALILFSSNTGSLNDGPKTPFTVIHHTGRRTPKTPRHERLSRKKVKKDQ